DKRVQDIFHPPLQPFHRVVRPNLLYSIFWTDAPVSETSVLQKLSALLKKYEPGFKLEGAFVPGVRGRADPNFSATRAQRLRLLAARKHYSPAKASVAETFAEMGDLHPDDGPEADPRIVGWLRRHHPIASLCTEPRGHRSHHRPTLSSNVAGATCNSRT